MKNYVIDTKKLKNVIHTHKGTEAVIIAQCPACARAGYDLNKQDHLIIFEDGSFACVVNPGDEGAEHRKEIFELVGIPAPHTVLAPSRLQRTKPRPINRIPTKITYITLKPRPPLTVAEPTDFNL